jgi:hypothetical protein
MTVFFVDDVQILQNHRYEKYSGVGGYGWVIGIRGIKIYWRRHTLVFHHQRRSDLLQSVHTAMILDMYTSVIETVASHWQPLSLWHDVVSVHLTTSGIRTVIGTDYTGNYKSNYHKIYYYINGNRIMYIKLSDCCCVHFVSF